jgi:EpsG-like putative glucosyltransferase
MAILIAFLFIIWPLLSLPFVLIGYFYDPKNRTFYSILFGIIIGLIAYYLVPPESYDLYRHHLLVDDFSTYDTSYFFKTLADTSEPLQALVNYGISLTHNHNLLQFSIVAMGYSILLYIIGDFAKRNNITKTSLFIVLAFTLTSFTCINFFSGLWNYIAMLIFALAFYWDTSRKKSKWLTYPLYLITPLIHSGMFFPVALLAIFKLFGEKINIRSVATMLAVFVAPSVLLPLINSLVDIPIFAQLEPMYNAYFLNGSQFVRLYGGNVLVMELIKITIYVVIFIGLKGLSEQEKKIRDYTLLLSFSTLLLIINSIVFLRFILLAQFIGAFTLMLFFNHLHTRKQLLSVIIIVVLSIFFTWYQYMTIRELNFDPLSFSHTLTSIFEIFRK